MTIGWNLLLAAIGTVIVWKSTERLEAAGELIATIAMFVLVRIDMSGAPTRDASGTSTRPGRISSVAEV